LVRNRERTASMTSRTKPPAFRPNIVSDIAIASAMSHQEARHSLFTSDAALRATTTKARLLPARKLPSFMCRQRGCRVLISGARETGGAIAPLRRSVSGSPRLNGPKVFPSGPFSNLVLELRHRLELIFGDVHHRAIWVPFACCVGRLTRGRLAGLVRKLQAVH